MTNLVCRQDSASDQADVPENEPELEEPIDEATLIEQRRKRREAIKAKYRGAATPLLVQALQLGNESGQSTPSTPLVDTSMSPSVKSGKSTNLCTKTSRANDV
jgi:serine/threonine-protein kinase PRP4